MDKVKNLLELLSNYNLDEKLAYERIILMFEVGQIVLPTLIAKISKDTIVYRSRENENVNLFNSVDDLSCPPKELVRNYSRVNRPFQSMFYGADSEETSYSEFMESWSYKPFGTVFNITIGQWRVMDDLNVIVIKDRERFGDEFNHIKGNIWDNIDTMTNDFLVNKFSQSAYKNNMSVRKIN